MSHIILLMYLICFYLKESNNECPPSDDGRCSFKSISHGNNNCCDNREICNRNSYYHRLPSYEQDDSNYL